MTILVKRFVFIQLSHTKLEPYFRSKFAAIPEQQRPADAENRTSTPLSTWKKSMYFCRVWQQDKWTMQNGWYQGRTCWARHRRT